MNIYVSNLAFSTQDDDLRNLFAAYGEVDSAKVVTDRETGRSRGFGFVEMSDDSAAQKAISELNQASIGGRNISVTEARPKAERPSGGGGYGNSPFKSNNGGYNKRRF